MKYYIVTAACGHVGHGRYVPIDFPIIAETSRDASRICRNIPRVKHGNKEAIIKVREVSRREYRLQQEANDMNPYLHARNRREFLAAGKDYSDSRSISELKRESNWKPRNDKVYESREQKNKWKLDSFNSYNKLMVQEVEYEIRFAM